MHSSSMMVWTASGLVALAAACGGQVEPASRTGFGDTSGEGYAALKASGGESRDEDGRGPCSRRVEFEEQSERVESELNIARRTVCRNYLHLADALADGYVNTGLACVPGQGYHYIKNSLVGTTDFRHPSVLMYTADGLLNGPEWVAPQSIPAPRIFGQQLHADDDLGLWILHVWVWKLNANGVFDDVNPAVTCP